MPFPISQEDLYRTCVSLQEEEWEVLESIYPDCISLDSGSRNMIKLEVPVEFGDSSGIQVMHTDADNPSDPQSTQEHTSLPRSTMYLLQLPPVLLDVTLPRDYPLRRPPTIVSLRSTYNWLPQIRNTRQALLNMWQEGECVLYSWIEWIRNGDFVDLLDLKDRVDGAQIIRLPHPTPSALIPLLLAHSHAVSITTFSNTSYTCSICFTSLKGTHCILLPCTHVFCRACLTDFWTLCIAEGDLAHVGCPDPACVKAGSEASEEVVKRVVKETDVLRWRWLRAKRQIEQDPTVMHCPLPMCQEPVPKPPVEPGEEDSGWERLRTCPSCHFSFCSFCKHSWHGPLTSCHDPASEELIREYLSHPEDSQMRIHLEKRHGRKYIQNLVRRTLEERESEQFIKSETVKCPRCEVQIQKSFGCNHMTCAKCQQHFCYLCGHKLDPQQPYRHFATPNSFCFNKLFDPRDLSLQPNEDDGWEQVPVI